MDTTCIIVISSIFGGGCLLCIGCIFFTDKKNNRITSIPRDCVVITREHYENLKNIVTSDLPAYTEPNIDLMPPAYIE